MNATRPRRGRRERLPDVAGLGIPQDRFPVSPRGQRFAVETIAEVEYSRRVPFQGAHLCPHCRVPEYNDAVKARGCQSLSVGAESHDIHFLWLLRQWRPVLAVGVPKEQVAVTAARRDPLSVGAEGNGEDVVGVSFQGQFQCTGRRFPDVGIASFAPRADPLTVGGERGANKSLGMPVKVRRKAPVAASKTTRSLPQGTASHFPSGLTAGTCVSAQRGSVNGPALPRTATSSAGALSGSPPPAKRQQLRWDVGALAAVQRAGPVQQLLQAQGGRTWVLR